MGAERETKSNVTVICGNKQRSSRIRFTEHIGDGETLAFVVMLDIYEDAWTSAGKQGGILRDLRSTTQPCGPE